MSRSKPFLERDFKGASMLLPIALQLRDNMSVAVEYDMQTATISTSYGFITVDTLAAVIDQIFAEIDKDPTILTSQHPDYRLHLAISLMIREQPVGVDPLFWQYRLAQRIVQYLTLNN